MLDGLRLQDGRYRPAWCSSAARCATRRVAGAAVFAVVAAAAIVAGNPTASGQPATATATWTGGSATSTAWSDAGNWSPGSVPSDGEALSFPAAASLSSSDSIDDLDGFTAASLALETGPNEMIPYAISGSPLTLGSGGLTSTDPSGTVPGASNELDLPVVLGASQTWTVSGDGPLAYDGVSGSSSSLTIDLSKSSNGSASTGGMLALGGDVEVGGISIVGADPSVTGASAAEDNGVVAMLDPLGLNGRDGNPVSVTDAGLFAAGDLGPLSVHAGTLFVGAVPMSRTVPDGAFEAHVVGDTSFDAKSAVVFTALDQATAPGTTYAQLSASGTVALGNAVLALEEGCTAFFTPGQRLTLVKAASVTGRFAQPGSGRPLHSGSVVTAVPPASCPTHEAPTTLKLTYAAGSVTATVLPGPGGSSSTGSVSPSATVAAVGHIASVTHAGLRLFVRCGSNAACHGTVTLRAAPGKEGSTLLARGSLSIPAGRARVVPLHSTVAGTRLLATLARRHARRATIATVDLQGGHATRHVVVV